MAFRLVDGALRAEANAVKSQTFVSEQVISATAPKAAYQRETPVETIMGRCLRATDRNLPGRDHRASLERGEFAAVVRGIRTVESALGDRCKPTSPEELDTAAMGSESLVSARELARGTVLTEHDIAIRRPGNGLAAALRSQLIGRRLSRDVPEGELFQGEMCS